ncbi:hypothetical protein [Metabacillus fastidiosus]|uniref:hypothetical protein n=1 Tax=Metabacillus fastidiosus TaxID=1458 RepID=UPI003D28AD1E
MSLTEVKLAGIVKKQYFYKLKANIDSLSALVVIQLLGILFSLGGIVSSGSGSNGFFINIKYFSADIVIIFTMIWSLVIAITITTKPYRNYDFSFVTNRFASNISNLCFLFTASAVGGITAMLAGGLLKILNSLFSDYYVYSSDFIFKDFILGIAMTILYIFFISSFGYLIGAFVQVNKLFLLFIPILFGGLLFMEAFIWQGTAVSELLSFYFMESSMPLFLLKIVVTSALLFSVSITILNRMEVR